MSFSNLNPEIVGQLMMEALAGDDPVSFFKDVVNDHANNIYFPEFFKMMEIPSGPESEYHPKGETVFDHSMAVLNGVCQLTDDPFIRLAAVLHDMGKLATPADNYPHHYYHESLGVGLVINFCKKFGFSSRLSNICVNVSKHHMKRSMKKPSKWLKLIKDFDDRRGLEALKIVILVDGKTDISYQIEKALEVSKIKVKANTKVSILKNMLDNPENIS